MVMDFFILHCCLYTKILVVKMYQSTQRGKSRFVRKRGKVRCSKFTKKSSGYSSLKSRISVKEGELNHHYEPCGCKSACGKDCLCLLNRTHCEKYCGYVSVLYMMITSSISLSNPNQLNIKGYLFMCSYILIFFFKVFGMIYMYLVIRNVA